MRGFNALSALLLLMTVYTCNRAGTELGQRERTSTRLVTSPPLVQLDPKILDAMLLGHSALYDDFATLWAIQFLAEPNLINSTTPEELSETLLTKMKHKPKVEGLYLLSCYVLGLDFKRPDLCEKISFEGLQAFPESWRIPMAQGFMASFLLKDDIKAAGYYELAASRPKSPPYVGKLAKRLAAKGFTSMQDLEDSLEIIKNVPGGARIVEVLMERLKQRENSPQPEGTP